MGSVFKTYVERSDESITFRLLAQIVFNLDTGIQWIALEEAGHAPRWAWRDPANGTVRLGTTTCDAELVDPLILTLADSHGETMGGDPHQLRFVVLSYAESVQVLARFGTNAYFSAGVETGADAYALGNKILSRLENWKQSTAPANQKPSLIDHQPALAL